MHKCDKKCKIFPTPPHDPPSKTASLIYPLQIPRLFRVTQDITADPATSTKATPSTAGMTTKVLKGSMWTLAGQVLPLFITFITTPITIRLLGSEGYGVLVLVGLIPIYFSFADFGMGVASTRFASAAFAEGDERREREVVWTAATIAFCTALLFAMPIFIFAHSIVVALNVPAGLQSEGAIALRVTMATFVINLIAGNFNTPQLSRLRMDLNSMINAGGRVSLAIATPTVIYLGGGIAGAAVLGLVAAVLMLAAHWAVSARLLPGMLRLATDRKLVRPLLRFGFGLLVSGIAAVLLGNVEKLALPRMVSVETLAFYSVAFTFANMASIYSLAMIQSLVPAFSQLQLPDKRDELQALFARSLRLNLAILLPTLMILFVVARPFFTYWAGEAFGRESTVPFYILLVGLLFNLMAFVPHAVLTAAGRTDIFAKLYWIELAVHLIVVVVLVGAFGIVGAAVAWSLRVLVDSLLLMVLSKKVVGVRTGLGTIAGKMLSGIAILSPPVLLASFYDNFSPVLIVLVPTFALVYASLVWVGILSYEEKAWFRRKVQGIPLVGKIAAVI